MLQGFPEELVWRGYALQLLDRRPLVSVVVTSVIFGAMHLVSLGEGYSLGERRSGGDGAADRCASSTEDCRGQRPPRSRDQRLRFGGSAGPSTW